MTYFLSIDYGGTKTKAILFDRLGHQVALSSFETLTIEDKPGFREVDLDETWLAIAESVKSVISKASIEAEEVKAVACIGHGKGLYLLDKLGLLYRNGILSTDNRAWQLAQSFEEKIDDIWSMTRQHIVASQSPVLLRWLKEHEPETYNKIGSVLSAKDFIRFKLTNIISQEIGDASGNHWINFETGNYDKNILAFFGILDCYEALPKLVDYQDIVGRVSQEAALLTGLAEGTPVIGGLFDIDACALGSGVLDDRMFSVISGTWNINSYPSRRVADKDSGQMTSYFPNRQFLVEASSPTSAGNLDKIIKIIMADEVLNYKQRGEKSIYDDLEVLLTQTDASYTPLLFTPFLYGSNRHQAATSLFIGMTTASSKSQMIRAVYEGIAFAHREHIQGLIASKGKKPEVIRMSGGATNSKAWIQLFADVLEIPIETVEGSEIGGLGGAIACLQAIEHLSLAQAIQTMVTVKERFVPNSKESLIYTKKYEVYQHLLDQLDPVWESVKSLQILANKKEGEK
ncbi:carbohydrate kinase [Streptococcus agalactiae LMG 14747]|uniref:Carbohydrate kinase n=1 Tax=Streptococcus agalactiae LMG 14747 TaxID=1154860 RepID=V6Z6M3_STRAG|nr:carbohydrate kinase [Streptococcus agalactiae LMG 14747]